MGLGQSWGGGSAPYAAALGAILCWATLAAALNASLGALAPAQILYWGFTIAAVTLSVWDAAQGRPLWRSWPGTRLALLGIYGLFGYHALLVLAFTLAPPPLANILNYTWPLWIILLSAGVPGHGKPWRALAGGMLGLAGVGIVMVSSQGGEFSTGWDATLAPGFALALLAGFCWGSFTVMLRLSGSGQPSMAWFCWFAALGALLWLAVLGEPLVPPTGWGVLLYIGMVPLALAFQLWEYAARHCDLQALGLFSYLTPPLSTALLALQAGTAVPGRAWGGLALILAGSALGAGWPRLTRGGRTS